MEPPDCVHVARYADGEATTDRYLGSRVRSAAEAGRVGDMRRRNADLTRGGKVCTTHRFDETYQLVEEEDSGGQSSWTY